MEQSEKLTGTQVYAIIQKEILGQHASEQACDAGSIVGIISMLENLSVYHRIHAWWILVQSWVTLRRVICWRFIVGSVSSFKDPGLRSFGGVTPDIHQRFLFHRKEGMVT